MVDDDSKTKLLAEIEKFGNVYSACQKTGINKATYYRWKKEDSDFRKKADHAERIGRSNMADMAEIALVQKLKEKDMMAIKYVLGHNSPRYRQNRSSKVLIEHVSHTTPESPSRPNTLFDYLKQQAIKRAEAEAKKSQDDNSST